LQEGQAGLQEQVLELAGTVKVIDEKVDMRHADNREDIGKLEKILEGNGQPGLKADVITIKADVAAIKASVDDIGNVRIEIVSFKAVLRFVGWALVGCIVPILAACLTVVFDKLHH
jgi:hypothetical protein